MNMKYISLIIIIAPILISCSFNQKTNNDHLLLQTTETITLLGDTLIVL